MGTITFTVQGVAKIHSYRKMLWNIVSTPQMVTTSFIIGFSENVLSLPHSSALTGMINYYS